MLFIDWNGFYSILDTDKAKSNKKLMKDADFKSSFNKIYSEMLMGLGV